MNNNKNFQSVNVIIVSISHFVHDIFSSFLAPLLPLLIEKLSINYSLASFLTVIQRLPSLLNPFIGILSDRIRLRYLVIISPAITTVVMSLLGLAPNYTVLAILLFVMGISSSLFHVPAPVMIKKISGDRIGKGMSFYMLGGELARTTGPMIIVGAVSLWGLEGTYRLMPFGIFASLILYYKLKKINISDEISKKNQAFNSKKVLKKYLPLFIVLSGFLFFRAFMRSALTVFLPTYFKDVQGQNYVYGGLVFAAYQLAGVIGAYFSGPISDKIGRKKTLLIISCVSPVLMVSFCFFKSFTIPILMLLGIFTIAQTPILLAIVNNINTKWPSFINSIYMTINFLISALGALIVGVSGDYFGLKNTFYFTAAVSIISIPFAIKLFKQKYN
ncbi:MAG: MFS transporter [Bacteroidales bacterium]|nr:MFS transporter [Bacteroidales bacterium]